MSGASRHYAGASWRCSDAFRTRAYDHFGAANEAWLPRKLTDIQKSPGYGRSKALPDVAICFIPPDTPTKARFKTHYATVIPQFDGCTPEPLAPFVATLKARVAGSPA